MAKLLEKLKTRKNRPDETDDRDLQGTMYVDLANPIEPEKMAYSAIRDITPAEKLLYADTAQDSLDHLINNLLEAKLARQEIKDERGRANQSIVDSRQSINDIDLILQRFDPSNLTYEQRKSLVQLVRSNSDLIINQSSPDFIDAFVLARAVDVTNDLRGGISKSDTQHILAAIRDIIKNLHQTSSGHSQKLDSDAVIAIAQSISDYENQTGHLDEKLGTLMRLRLQEIADPQILLGEERTHARLDPNAPPPKTAEEINTIVNNHYRKLESDRLKRQRASKLSNHVLSHHRAA